MSGERIEVGAIVELRGQQHSITEALGDGRLRLETLDGSASPIAVPRAQLERAYVDGLLKFPLAAWHEKLHEDPSGPKLTQDITLLPKALQDETRRRAEYVKAALKVVGERWESNVVRPVLQEVSDKVGDNAPPSLSTVARWYRRYLEADKDIRALVPRHKWRGRRGRRIDPVIASIIDAMIERYYLTRERKTVPEVYENLQEEVRRANKHRSPFEQLAIPSLRLLYAEIAKLDPYCVCEKRYGKAYADRKFAQTGRGIHATRPLERVEIDHTKADLMVVDDQTRLPIGRPWITVLVDKFSRMIFGIHIGFTPPSFISVMHALRHGILPKADLRERYPEIENDWPIHGKPETIISDNGAEFLSKSFEHSLNDIGVDLELNNPGQPLQKGAVERFLGVMNRGLLQRQPGTTFSNVLDRNDYDPSKNAVVSLSFLKRVVFRFICDFYHVRYHRGLGGQPLAVYLEAAKKYPPPALPRSVEDLAPLLCSVDERAVHHYGVEIHGLKYNRPELALIRHRLDGGKAKIRFDEENLAEIYVWDQFEQRYLTVPCTDPEYAEGLTLWQHKVIKRNAVQQGMRDVDTAQLARVRREIQEMVEACWMKRSKTGHKQKAARWLKADKIDGVDIDVATAIAGEQRKAISDAPPSTADESSLMSELLSSGGWDAQPISSYR